MKFQSALVNKTENPGDLFQRFVFELLRKSDYPRLHKFQTAGKDGGIDLIQQFDRTRTVVECKYIGNNDIEEARKKWRITRKHLENQLVTPNPKEKQYKPWLNTAKPIAAYLFCVSSGIKNQNGFDEFEEEINDFFKNLATEHPHLTHLYKISAEILDWSKLVQKLDDNLPLKFKWFPLAEKFGFIPLQNRSPDGSFRTFLEEDSLPFYYRKRHLEKEPNAEIENEEQLLEMLNHSSFHGHIITGNGGTGKTRLTIELGRLAYKTDWLVFRCKETVTADNLNRFVETIAADTKVLLLMDYVETQQHFTDITEQVSILNENYGFQIKYVANCRSSYYPTIRSTPRHHQVLLTSSLRDRKADDLWLETYQASVVGHILEKGGLKNEEKYLAVCKNKPILAVFLLYLHQKNKGEDLQGLLNEADFGKWIQKRIKMSFSNVSDFEMKLAKLVAMLPFAEEAIDRFDEFNTKLLGILANDGWIETLPTKGWRSIHDVFADQIILSYSQDNQYFVERFVRDIFSLAYSNNCLGSAFITAQRLSPYFDIDFNTLIKAEIYKELQQWRMIRNDLLETSLLNEAQKLDLFSTETLWEDAEKDQAFQTSLGTIIRRTVESDDSLTETQLLNAKTWLCKTLPFISSNNFLLRWALKFSPEDIKELALDRMRVSSREFHSRYVFSAWLDSHLPTSEIREYLRLWLDNHKSDYEAIFIFESWLWAKGDLDLIKVPLEFWFAKHQASFKTIRLYKAWLRAKGDLDFIKKPLRMWLDEHQKSWNARFIYEMWLRAKGDLDFIKAPIGLWLSENQTVLDAGYIYDLWIGAKGDLDFIEEPLLIWLEKNQATPNAAYIYESWIKARGDLNFIEEPLRVWLEKNQTTLNAAFIYESWLKAGGELDFIKKPLQLWLAEHQTTRSAESIYKHWRRANGDFIFIRDHAANWMTEHPEHRYSISLAKIFKAKEKNLSPRLERQLLKFEKHLQNLKRISQLGDSLFDMGAAEKLLPRLENAIDTLLSKGGLDFQNENELTLLFVQLFSNPRFRDSVSTQKINQIYTKWIKHPSSFDRGFTTLRKCQEPIILERFTKLIDSNLLDINTDRNSVERFLRHFNNWLPENREKLRPVIRQLQAKHPSTVWKVIVLSE